MHRPVSRLRRARGFTLLELLLVIVILSSVAWMLTGSIGDNISQVRYEDTRNRLKAIREAVLGPTSASALEAGILSGYVVDNGVLPVNIDALVERPKDLDDPENEAKKYIAWGTVVPIFDPDPDNRGVNNGGETELSQPAQLLMKGHRGAYVSASPKGWFRDGWGTNKSSTGAVGIACPTVPDPLNPTEGSDVDADNHGWCVSLSRDGLYVDSYGMDGQAGKMSANAYEEDMPLTPPVLSNDWQTDLTGRSVTLINSSGNPIPAGAHLRVSLLVFENSTPASMWRRLTTELVPEGTLAANGETTVIFPNAVSPATNMVPIGEHLLVLVSDPDGDVHTSDDTPDLLDPQITEWPGSQKYVTARVKFYPRGGVPAMRLEIR